MWILPSNDLQELKEYVSGNKDLLLDGKKVKLSGFLHIYNNPELITDYWSTNFNNPPVVNIVDDFFSPRHKDDYLESAGLSFEDYQKLENKSLKANIFDPSKADTGDLNDQAITGADRLPFIFCSSSIHYSLANNFFRLLYAFDIYARGKTQ